MKIVTSFKHLEHTPALDERIKEKSERLHKYFEGQFNIHWTCYIGDDKKHHAEIQLRGPNFEYHAHAHADNLYKCFDLAVEKIEKQVHKKKDKWKKNIGHKHKPSMKDVQIHDLEMDEAFWEEQDYKNQAS